MLHHALASPWRTAAEQRAPARDRHASFRAQVAREVTEIMDGMSDTSHEGKGAAGRRIQQLLVLVQEMHPTMALRRVAVTAAKALMALKMQNL